MKVLILNQGSISAEDQEVIKPFLKSRKHKIVGCIAHQRPQKSIGRKLKENIKKGRGGFVMVMGAEFLINKITPEKKTTETPESFFGQHHIPVLRTKRLYTADKKRCSKEVSDFVKETGAEATLLVGYGGIIKKPFITLNKGKVLSYHFGNMRKYRGTPPAFWELYNGEKEMGVTVQLVSTGIDCGIPVKEKSLKFRPHETFFSAEKLYTENSRRMMYEAVEHISSPKFLAKKISRYGPIYSQPGLKQWFKQTTKDLLISVSYKRKNRISAKNTKIPV